MKTAAMSRSLFLILWLASCRLCIVSGGGAVTVVGDLIINETNAFFDCDTLFKINGEDKKLNTITRLEGDVYISTETNTATAASCLTLLEAVEGSIYINDAIFENKTLSFPVLNHVVGNIYIEHTTQLENIQIPYLVRVEGSLKIHNNTKLSNIFNITNNLGGAVNSVKISQNSMLDEVKFFNLEQVYSSVEISGNGDLDYVKFWNLKSTWSIAIIGGTQNNPSVLNGIWLPNLEKVYGKLSIKYSKHLYDIEFPKLVLIGFMDIKINSHLENVRFPTLTNATGNIFFYGNTQLKNTSFPRLKRIDGGLDIGYYNDLSWPHEKLTTLDMPLLEFVNDIYLINAGIEEISFPSLTFTTGITMKYASSLSDFQVNLLPETQFLTFEHNPVLKTLACQSLKHVEDTILIRNNSALELMDLSALETAGEILLDDNDGLQNVVLNKLDIVGDDLRIMNNDGIERVIAPKLSQAKEIEVESNSNLNSVVFPELSSLTELVLIRNEMLGNLSLPLVTSLKTLYLEQLGTKVPPENAHMDLSLVEVDGMSLIQVIFPFANFLELTSVARLNVRDINIPLSSLFIPKLETVAHLLSFRNLSGVDEVHFTELHSAGIIRLKQLPDLNLAVFPKLQALSSLQVYECDVLKQVAIPVIYPPKDASFPDMFTITSEDSEILTSDTFVGIGFGSDSDMDSSCYDTSVVESFTGPCENECKPELSWADSYEVDGRCHCDTTFDHGIGDIEVCTAQGVKTVVEICNKIKEKYGEGSTTNRTYYNTVNCGHGPANDNSKGDEDIDSCPGMVNPSFAPRGCQLRGVPWDLDDLFPGLSPSPSPSPSSPQLPKFVQRVFEESPGCCRANNDGLSNFTLYTDIGFKECKKRCLVHSECEAYEYTLWEEQCKIHFLPMPQTDNSKDCARNTCYHRNETGALLTLEYSEDDEAWALGPVPLASGGDYILYYTPDYNRFPYGTRTWVDPANESLQLEVDTGEALNFYTLDGVIQNALVELSDNEDLSSFCAKSTKWSFPFLEVYDTANDFEVNGEACFDFYPSTTTTITTITTQTMTSLSTSSSTTVTSTSTSIGKFVSSVQPKITASTAVTHETSVVNKISDTPSSAQFLDTTTSLIPIGSSTTLKPASTNESSNEISSTLMAAIIVIFVLICAGLVAFVGIRYKRDNARPIVIDAKATELPDLYSKVSTMKSEEQIHDKRLREDNDYLDAGPPIALVQEDKVGTSQRKTHTYASIDYGVVQSNSDYATMTSGPVLPEYSSGPLPQVDVPPVYEYSDAGDNRAGGVAAKFGYGNRKDSGVSDNGRAAYGEPIPAKRKNPGPISIPPASSIASSSYDMFKDNMMGHDGYDMIAKGNNMEDANRAEVLQETKFSEPQRDNKNDYATLEQPNNGSNHEYASLEQRGNNNGYGAVVDFFPGHENSAKHLASTPSTPGLESTSMQYVPISQLGNKSDQQMYEATCNTEDIPQDVPRNSFQQNMLTLV
eukprot:m.35965 g.35965  ORF g.35965 m.35965 type:complete len:1480 (-) comp8995_c0_seq2:86-4525(-)